MLLPSLAGRARTMASLALSEDTICDSLSMWLPQHRARCGPTDVPQGVLDMALRDHRRDYVTPIIITICSTFVVVLTRHQGRLNYVVITLAVVWTGVVWWRAFQPPT